MTSSLFLYEPFYDFDRLFDDALHRRSASWANNGPTQQQLQRRDVHNTLDDAMRAFKPRMDLHEDSEKNIVTATFELPGVKKEDVQIDSHNGRLIVSAETKLSTEHEESGYAVRERRFGKFSRTLQLPQGVKDEEINALMEDGVLTLTFPKSTPELAPKKITVM